MKIQHRSNTENRVHHIFNTETDYHVKTEFLYAGVVSPKKKWSEIAHSHSFIEILYILDGHGTINISGNTYEVKTGDLVIYDEGKEHYEVSSDENPLKINFVAFKLNVGSFLQHGEPFIYNTGYQYEIFKYYFDGLINEVTTKTHYYKEAVNSLLRIILVNVFRLIDSEVGSTSNSVRPSKIVSETINYLDQYFLEDFAIDDVADAIHVSKYHLIRLFKSETNTTINEYLNDKRLDYSKELLVNSDFTISEIANNCGYNSLNYFCRRFKKQFGVTPTEYKEKSINK